LYLFIKKYAKSNFEEIVCFAKGLAKDIDAVGNSVASSLSNEQCMVDAADAY